MATRLFPPFYQFEDADGAPLVGGSLEFYTSGTLNSKDTYADAGLTIPNGTITLNDLGRSPVPIFAGTGDYRVILRDADGVIIGDEDPVSGDAASTATSGSGLRNLLINGDFSINQRQATTVADDAYCFDAWYVLAQSGSVTVAQQTLQANGMPTNARLTQPDVAAKRIGLAQIIESTRCRHLRGATVTLSGKIRHSVAAPIRYAILSWTGAADNVTSDVVLDWTSASYTPGGFFLAASVVVQAVGVVTPGAATITDLPPISATLSRSMNNLIVMVWTGSVTAQNATLDLGNLQMEAGAEATAFDHLPRDMQLAACHRYYAKSFGLTTAPAQNTEPVTALRIPQVVGAATRMNGATVWLPQTMRSAAMAITTYNPSAANAEVRNNTTGADCTLTGVTQTGDRRFTISTTTPAGSAAGNALIVHWTADASL